MQVTLAQGSLILQVAGDDLTRKWLNIEYQHERVVSCSALPGPTSAIIDGTIPDQHRRRSSQHRAMGCRLPQRTSDISLLSQAVQPWLNHPKWMDLRIPALTERNERQTPAYRVSFSFDFSAAFRASTGMSRLL